MKNLRLFHSLACIISIDYRSTEQFFINKCDEDRLWFLEEFWFCSFGVELKLFKRDEIYYDGHRANSITILGLKFTNGYTYDSHRAE